MRGNCALWRLAFMRMNTQDIAVFELVYEEMIGISVRLHYDNDSNQREERNKGSGFANRGFISTSMGLPLRIL